MASAGQYSHEDYTVAWLCALSVEMAAAEAMLDETHPSLPTSSTDDNTYILGRIFGHNVVISCLRSGVYGTTSAATSATQLQSTFNCLRVFLMVGIGGGVPCEKADIRLGDVVVSKPTRDFGGVVQYDYGKTIADGHFERTGILNKPSSILLTAVSRLESAHRISSSKIPNLMSDMLRRHPTMVKHFTYPGHDKDQLFVSDYIHADAERPCDDCGCDPGRILNRCPRSSCDPVIHYGLIASGNQVMKDAITRDKISRELGVLCFEMEAAGLMDDFRCLVIRGICDYSDSHKNKQWQEYAAVTAAAYAKELLSVLPTVQQIKPNLCLSHGVEVSYYGENIQCGGNHPANEIVRRRSREVPLSKISSYDQDRVHQRLLQKRLVGTTKWFLEHPDFKDWLGHKAMSCLWCSGKIGSGKTMIATTAVEAALYRYSKKGAPTIFFYCEHEYRETLSAAYILSSFIKQLCDYLFLTTMRYPKDVEGKIRRFFGEERTQPDLNDLQDILFLLLRYVPDTVGIIDGLDALEPKEAKALVLCMQRLCSLKRAEDLRILVLSRDQVPGYINIATVFPGARQIQTSRNVMPDIEIYIRTSIADKTLYRKLTDNTDLLNEVEQTLLRESSGMFLWVYLQLEILWDTCYSDAEIRTALDTLPKGLDETYNRCIERIIPSANYGLKVLKWIGFAVRPLHIDELRVAVAFSIEDTKWDPERLPQKNVLIGSCANLVIMDQNDSSVRFAHSSVKQYLEQLVKNQYHLGQGFRYPSLVQGNLECGELCITYLSFSDFSLQLSKRSRERMAISVPSPALLAKKALFRPNTLANRFFSRFAAQGHDISQMVYTIRTPSAPDRTRYKFLDYAVASWALHTKGIEKTSPSWDKFETLATSFNETWNFHPWSCGGRSQDSLLHGLFSWAVKEEHVPLLSIAVRAGPSFRRICNLPLLGESLPALHVACKLGYNEIVRLLLQFCDARARDGDRYTALHHAASGGHIRICQMLLSTKNIEVDALANLDLTPLWLAASNGHNEVVSTLCDMQANIESKGGQYSQTPLSKAAEYGHYIVVKQLLDRGAVIDIRAERSSCTPLRLAVQHGHETVVELLLDHGCPLEPRGGGESGSSETILLPLAAREGKEAVVKLLLDRGALIDTKDQPYHETALHEAVKRGHEAVLRILLDNQRALQILIDRGPSLDYLLFQTIQSDDEWAAEQLLAADEGLNQADNLTRRMRHLTAVKQGKLAVVKYLLDRGANLEDGSWLPPLLRAAKFGKTAIAGLLIDRGANLECLDTYGLSPLAWAAIQGHEATVKLLLDRGAHVDGGSMDCTPLLLAIREGHAAVTELLIDRGANVNPESYSTIGSPLSLAKRRGNKEIKRLLLAKGAEEYIT
ncbi:ankyrin repeat-containing domain protein [Aspergillus heterothallicus]